MHRTTAILTVGLILLALPPPAAAQNATGRGSSLVAGTAQVTGHRDIGNDRRTLVLELAPRLGYFILPGLALNANLRAFVGSSDAGTSYAWGLGPGVTYYFRAMPRIYPFLSARTLFTWSHSRSALNQSTFEDHSSSWLVSGGAVVMLVTHVGVSAELFYQHDNFSAEYGSGVASNQGEQYGLRFGIAAFVF